MWLAYLLIAYLVANISFGKFQPISVQRTVEEIQAVSGTLKMAANQLQNNLKLCMGDHYPMLLSFPPLPNFSSLESIKTMLKPGHSEAILNEMHSQAGSLVSVAMWYMFSLQTKTNTDQYELYELLYQTSKEFNVINWKLRDIEIFWFALWNSPPNVEFVWYNYAINRKSLRSLRALWSRWTFNLRNASDYDNLRVGCRTYDMNDWFSRFNETMSMWTNNGSRYPMLQKRDRSLYTTMARFTKSDMCEATILLGVCDEVLNSSDNNKNRNLASVIGVYQRLAEMFTEADRDLVTNAGPDIARNTENYAREANEIWNGLPLAQAIRTKLKEQFYWLEFTVIIFQVGEMKSIEGKMEWEQKLNYKEYANAKKAFCVIPVGYGMSTNENVSWKAIVYVGAPSPTTDPYKPIWIEVEEKRRNCWWSPDEFVSSSSCDAKEFFDVTTAWNGGVPVASYFLSAYPNYFTPYPINPSTSYKVFGPAGPPDRAAQLEKFGFEMFADKRKQEAVPVFVIAAAPCDPDIFAYIDN